MATTTLFHTQNNSIVPISSFTKRTKTINFASYISASGWTVPNASIIFFSDSLGVWWAQISANLLLTSGTVTGLTDFTFANVTFENNEVGQALAVTLIDRGVGYIATTAGLAMDNANTIRVGSSGNYDAAIISGTVRLASEPTTYTVSANMENPCDVVAYIPPASASSSGIVTNLAQTMAGVKTFSDGIKQSYYMGASRGTSNQTLTKDGYRTVICNDEFADSNNNYDSSTGIYTIPVAGLYEAFYNLSVTCGATAASSLTAGVSYNDSNSLNGACYLTDLVNYKTYLLSCRMIFSLAASATLRLKVYPESQDVSIGYSNTHSQSTFFVRYLGAA